MLLTTRYCHNIWIILVNTLTPEMTKLLEITVIEIIDFGGVTSAFVCYLYSTRKVDNIG